jgi:hypothetical protein
LGGGGVKPGAFNFASPREIAYAAADTAAPIAAYFGDSDAVIDDTANPTIESAVTQNSVVFQPVFMESPSRRRG